jgi:hydroxymethylbilane synthase
MKDVPTALPVGIVQAAVLERATTLDILVHKGNVDFLNELGIIATGSLRRQAQWLNKYPTHKAVDLRGNVNTRMQKLQDSDWNGAFCRCRIRKNQLKASKLYQFRLMIPAPHKEQCLLSPCRKIRLQ